MHADIGCIHWVDVSCASLTGILLHTSPGSFPVSSFGTRAAKRNGGSMRYTINIHGASQAASVKAEAGYVDFNGARLMPFEAAMLADALSECAEKAEDKAAEKASKLQPAEA